MPSRWCHVCPSLYASLSGERAFFVHDAAPAPDHERVRAQRTAKAMRLVFPQRWV
nr:hypothetical protein [Kibdelosporangium sp. MJ126-NF4]CTQ89927.1 hypothetical protein [Kibdelosporangium sp. MJ126-NF4]